jgi:hypothetical protein
VGAELQVDEGRQASARRPRRFDQKVGKVPVFAVTLWNLLCLLVTVTGSEMKIL